MFCEKCGTQIPDDASALIAERFPKLVNGYKEPAENSFWISIDDARVFPQW